jgi:hypothetical protein
VEKKPNPRGKLLVSFRKVLDDISIHVLKRRVTVFWS